MELSKCKTIRLDFEEFILLFERWDMNTTDEIITLVGHSRSVRCLHVDGTNEVRLVSGSNDRSIKVWSISINQTWSKCACKLTLLGHTDTVRCLVVILNRFVFYETRNCLGSRRYLCQW